MYREEYEFRQMGDAESSGVWTWSDKTEAHEKCVRVRERERERERDRGGREERGRECLVGRKDWIQP